MKVLFSPAKKQEYGSWGNFDVVQPIFSNEISELIAYLQTLSKIEIEQMMSISPELADLNFHRFQEFNVKSWTCSNTGPAILSFRGDAYKSLSADSLSESDLMWANQHLYILSGLYGLLHPMDPIQYYRLEMKTKLIRYKYRNLYDFWGDKIKQQLGNNKVINLSSGEYFKASRISNCINIDFKEPYQNSYKTIGIKAKKARGLMLRYIILNKIKTPEKLKEFDGGYNYSSNMSSTNNWVFIAERH